jgi:heat shock protein HslJ
MTSRLALRSATRGRLAGAVMVLLLLAVAAWPGVAEAQGRADPADPDRLQYKWQLLEYRDDGELVPVPPGIGITMLLFADTVTIEGACSSARSEFSLQAQSIEISPPAIEARGCDPATQAIDDAFYQGLTETSTWETSGGCETAGAACRPPLLTLKDVVGDPVMTLTSATLPADPGLSRWDLGRIGAADGAIAPVITGVDPWIEFQRGGHVVGSSGCGSFLGTYTTNGTTMRISDVVTASPDCTSALREQADTIIATLGEVTDFEVLPAGLVLKDAGGLTRLAFVPAIDLEGRTWTPFEVRRDGEVLETESGLLGTSAVRFAGREADGRSICRTFEGQQLSSGLALTVVGLRPDERYRCGRARKGQFPAQDVEAAFLGALERTASHALRGDELVLMDVDGNTVLRLEPQAPLAGPTWVLDEIDIAPLARSPKRRKPIVADQPITAVFSELGFLQGSTGVTEYDAEYAQRRGGQIDITDPVPLETVCRGPQRSRKPLCVQQQRFLEYLERADVIVVRADGSEMRLNDGERILLRFVPESLAAEPAEDEAPAEEAEG